MESITRCRGEWKYVHPDDVLDVEPILVLLLPGVRVELFERVGPAEQSNN